MLDLKLDREPVPPRDAATIILVRDSSRRGVEIFCVERSKRAAGFVRRKFFYVFTCEYCFSHYVALFFLLVSGYRLLFEDWRGLLVAWFSLVWVANLYMSLYGRLRLDIKGERVEIELKEQVADDRGER